MKATSHSRKLKAFQLARGRNQIHHHVLILFPLCKQDVHWTEGLGRNILGLRQNISLTRAGGKSILEWSSQNYLLPIIRTQSSQTNILLWLFEFVDHTLGPPNSQWSAKFFHFFLSMKAPKLPTTLCSSERLNDLLASWMFLQETRAIKYNVIDHDHCPLLDLKRGIKSATYASFHSQGNYSPSRRRLV